MLSLLPLLPLLAGAPHAGLALSQDEWVTLGEVQVFGQTDPDGRAEPARTIQLRFPRGMEESVDFDGPGFERQGGKILINQWGNLDRLRWAGDSVEEIRVLRERALQSIAAGNATPWKVRAYIFSRTDLLRKDANGVWVIQDDVLTDEDIVKTLESFVRMEALVEAYSQGAIDVQIDYSIERDPIAREDGVNAVFTFAPQSASPSFYSARYSRSDYDSVMSVYSAAEADALLSGTSYTFLDGMAQSTSLYSNGKPPMWLTRELLRAFFEGLRSSAWNWGYGSEYTPLIPGPRNDRRSSDLEGLRSYAGTITTEMWRSVRNRTLPDYDVAYGLIKPFDGQLKRWGDVAADPWGRLPVVTEQDIATRIGATALQVLSQGDSMVFRPEGGNYRTPIKSSVDPYDSVLNNQLNTARESIARIGYSDRDLLFIRFDMADFVISSLADHPAGAASPANVLGILVAGDTPVIVVDTKLSNDTLVETNLLGAGVAVHGKGVVEVGDPIALRFVADAPDARFSVTELDGTGVTISNGELQVPTQNEGVRVYKVISARPTGERTEQPFVVKIVPPVSIDSFAYNHGRLSAWITNNGPERQLSTDLQLPAGWQIEQGMPTRIGAYESRNLTFEVQYPSSRLGSGGATLSVAAAGRPGATARTALDSGTGTDLVTNTFEGGAEGWNVVLPNRGSYSAEAVQDAERGNVLAVKDGGGARFGHVQAYGRLLDDGTSDPMFGGYSVEDYPYVNFMLKSGEKAPVALSVVVNGRRYVAPIIGAVPTGRTSQPWLERVKFEPNGTWQQVSYNLAEALPGSQGRRFVTQITFGHPREWSDNPYMTERQGTHWIDDFKISSSAAANAVTADSDGEVEPVGDMSSSDPYLRALGASRATGTPDELVRLRALLTDEEGLVRLNVAEAFTRIKDPDALPILIEAARMERVPYPAVMLVRALVAQESPEAWDAFKVILRQGRAEELSIIEISRQMIARQDPRFIEDMSILLTGRHWSTRQAGAQALGTIRTEASNLMLLSFLMEVDPMVRMAVAKVAQPDVELVARRMEWASVNDLSTAVRAHSFAALTKASDPLRRSRGYAGLKEDDPEIRRIVAERVATWPNESHVAPLMGLLSDPVPSVRNAALLSLLSMPYPRNFSEMSVLAGERDEAVLLTLLDSARQKKIEIPRSMLERLATHRNARIRELVRELTT